MRSWRRNPESGPRGRAQVEQARAEPRARASSSRRVCGRTVTRGRGSFRVAFAGALAVGVLDGACFGRRARLCRNRRRPGSGEGEARRARARRDHASTRRPRATSTASRRRRSARKRHEARPGQVQEGQEGARRPLPQAAVHRLGHAGHESPTGRPQVAPSFLRHTCEECVNSFREQRSPLRLSTALVPVGRRRCGNVARPEPHASLAGADAARTAPSFSVAAGEPFTLELAAASSRAAARAASASGRSRTASRFSVRPRAARRARRSPGRRRRSRWASTSSPSRRRRTTSRRPTRGRAASSSTSRPRHRAGRTSRSR